MCHNKPVKYINREFTLAYEKLECVKSYSYLGIEISNACLFILAQKTGRQSYESTFQVERFTV